MPKGFSDHEKELIRRRLIKAGDKQFSAYGLKKTNIEELAQAAHISKGAFYLFYDSKEALFMDVAEEAEKRYRQDILAAIDEPGPSPRARLFVVLKKSFELVRTIPLLRVFNNSDYEVLFRRMPVEKIQEHFESDRVFLGEFVARCASAGIPIRVPPERMGALLYPLVLLTMHEDDFGESRLAGSMDLLLELVVAFYLGEVETYLQVEKKVVAL